MERNRVSGPLEKKMKDSKVPLSLEEYAEKAILGLSCFIIGVLALIGALSITGV